MLGLLRSFLGLEPRVAAGADVRAMSRQQLVFLIGEGFRRRGYAIIANARQNADVLLRKDAEDFLVQCGQWKAAKIGVGALRALHDAIAASDAAGGFMLTAGAYTDEAREFAKQNRIELMDGAALEQLMLEARLPEPFLDPTEGRRQTSFRTLEVEPTCPGCGGAMVKRTAISGAHKGKDFWGCLQYPQCRGTREA